jgi:VIT1/CCC1 family predicted Fe2+/Mn2+ transporter
VSPLAVLGLVSALLVVAPLDTAPQGGNGFAGSIVVAFVAVGLLVILARWTMSKPKRPRKPRR